MTSERWQRIKELLDRSLELDPAARPSYLDAACAGDSDMIAEVRSLIASFEEAGDFLDRPPETGIGPYRILEEIGHGGMGTVYRATRTGDPSGAEFAVKVVKRGMDQDYVLRRFRHEREILATLAHPNIARLQDEGTTGDGRPYFVMEYVKGVPIDEFCDRHKLTTTERLRLFQKVCAAVEFAHQQLIIHRDIKPGNILIDSAGAPKLLDFGIAKVLDSDFPGQTVDPTATVMRLMTPEYASPEQVRGDPVTAAADVYSLGVLLYELLTGHRPYQLKHRLPHQLAQIICEEDPQKPSTAVKRVESITRPTGRVSITPETVSADRAALPADLSRQLAGDLDSIVMKAMRKEPLRRYLSAAAMAEDLKRYLVGQRVAARADAFRYKTSKFYNRHKPAIISASFFASLAAIIVASVIWSERTRPPWHGGTPRITPSTSLPADELEPAYSPDGSRLAFVWNGENSESYDIYVKAPGAEQAVRVTSDPEDDRSPAWSPDGTQIAFVHAARENSGFFVVPARGGMERKISDAYPARLEAVGRQLAWTPDGKRLLITDRASPTQPFALSLLDLATGERRPLTSPPASSVGDSNPAISPDGQMVAFIRAPSSGVTDLYTVPLAGGEIRRITMDNRWLIGAAWTPDGREIVFSSNRGGSLTLWRVGAGGGKPVRLPGMSENTTDPVFSRDGRRLAYSQYYQDANIWQIELSGFAAAGRPARLISSSQYDSSPQYSPEGARIAFRSSRSGYNEIWLARSDGQNPRQVTRFRGTLTGTPRWSPYGTLLAFDSRPTGQADIFVIHADGGEPRRITSEASEDVVPSWSRDGKWIYFASNRSGSWQVWKAPAEGGDARQVTRNGGFAAFESPDGKYVYYAKGRSLPGLWRVPSSGGEETEVLDRLRPGYWGYWAITRHGVFFIDRTTPQGAPLLQFFDLQSRGISRVAAIEKPLLIGDSALAVSPDLRHVAFSQNDLSGSDIMQAEFVP